MTSGCLDEDVLGQLIEGRLPARLRAAAEEHLDGCPACRRLVALGFEADDAGAAPALPSDEGLARYQLGEPVAATRAGRIHAARDTRLRRDVAILLVDDRGPGAIERLREQARVHARIDHPGVGRILEVGADEGRGFAVLQLADVAVLAEAALEMSLEEKVRVLRDIALAVHAAHEAGCGHGDLGPDLVLIERGDDGGPAPRVLGFAAAAPDRRADVHALGGLLYLLCAGRPPAAPGGEAVTAGDEPLPLRQATRGVPRDLDTVAMHCLRAAAGERYPTALAVARELERYLDGEPVTARPTSAVGRLRTWTRRRRGLLVAVALAVTAVLAVALTSYLATRAERRAVVRRELAQGLAAADAAGRLAASARAAREEALARFRAGGGAEAEAAWARAAAVDEECRLEHARAERAFEAALVWDPGRADVRDAMARTIAAQAARADEQRDRARRDALLARLALYDRHGRHLRGFVAPPTLELITRPAGAQVEVHRYLADGRGLLAEQAAGEVVTPVVLRDLAPGSYLLIVRAAGREPMRHPVLLRPNQAARVELELPLAGAVPAGFVAIAPGRAFVGSDAEGVRAVTEAMPLHEVDTAGYLVAVTETTVAEWMTFLATLPADERDRRRPRARHFGAAVELAVVAGGWEYRVEHAGGWRAAAAEGEPLRHPGRTRRVVQDWRRFPVTGISLDDALAYVAWLDRSGRLPGARLCSEVELDRAARGADDRRFPRGATLDPDDANLLETYGAAGLGLDEVGSHPGGRSPFAVDDLVGNVGELVAPVAGGERALSAGAEDYAELSGAAIGRRAVMPRAFRTPTAGLRVCAPPGRRP